MQTKSNLARVNGIELGYQVFGKGKRLVLLHGGFGSLEMFGPNIDLLAKGRQVIAVDLQSHGRSPAAGRPMRFESMGDDIAALIRELGLERAAIMGFSLGGGVALRAAIQHPDLVDRLVLVSTPFANHGWHPEMTAGMKSMGPETAEPMKQSPMYEAYKQVAPNIDDWPILVEQLTTLLKIDYDWSADIPKLSMPVMLVIGDADGLPPSHAVEFFRLLGGGLRDANWDRSGMTRHRLAILPGVTHYAHQRRPRIVRRRDPVSRRGVTDESRSVGRDPRATLTGVDCQPRRAHHPPPAAPAAARRGGAALPHRHRHRPHGGASAGDRRRQDQGLIRRLPGRAVEPGAVIVRPRQAKVQESRISHVQSALDQEGRAA